jgi:hypothetical protein
MWTLQIPHGIHQESMGEGKVLEIKGMLKKELIKELIMRITE